MKVTDHNRGHRAGMVSGFAGREGWDGLPYRSLCGRAVAAIGFVLHARIAPFVGERSASRGMLGAVCLVALLLLLVSCERVGRHDQEVYRPLIVYMALDNDLQGEYDARMSALCSGWRPGMEVWVYADTPSGAALAHLEQTSAGVVARTVETYGVENSASGEVLERVLRRVWTLCPAEGYGLVFFSHATGWLPEGALARPLAEASPVDAGVREKRVAVPRHAGDSDCLSGRDGNAVIGVRLPWCNDVSLSGLSGTDAATRTIGRDGSTEIAIECFAAAIPEGMPMDYILFEACLMAGVEVAMELCGHTEWLLVSSAELLVPGFLPLYGGELELLASRHLPIEELLVSFGQHYMRYVRDRSGVYRSATLGVVCTGALPTLAVAVRDATAGRAGEIASAEWLAGVQHFDRPGQYGDRPAAARFFDLAAYVERLNAESGAGDAALADFHAALGRAVVWSDATEQFMGGAGTPYGGFAIEAHSGLTVYVPCAAFPGLNDAYRLTAWYRALTQKEL